MSRSIRGQDKHLGFQIASKRYNISSGPLEQQLRKGYDIQTDRQMPYPYQSENSGEPNYKIKMEATIDSSST